jgi:UDP-N-acetylglucosamine/UDP-N-acetylgalactosamine diphosphorylase
MAGGTDKKNHSEVGSSYIHFNFTPNQDKAAPSLLGDVPRGVMLNQPPIFLGGQGGLVGPVKSEFGTIVAAGSIVRKDLLRRDVMVFNQPSISKSMPFHPGLYSNLKRIMVFNQPSISKSMPFHPGLYSNLKRIITINTVYISNLIAMRRWYLDVRSKFMGKNMMERALYEGAVEKLFLRANHRQKAGIF